MFLASILLLAQVESRYNQPTYFLTIVVLMLAAGLVLWLVAAVLGFARAKAFGPSTWWFAVAAVCMIIYHLQFLLLAMVSALDNSSFTLAAFSLFNLFAVVAAICSIMGFIRLTQSR